MSEDQTKTEAKSKAKEIYTDVPKNYMKKYERYESVNASHNGVSTFKKCQTLYFFQNVLRKVSKESNIFFVWGGAYHKFRELLELEYGLDDKPYNEEKAFHAFTIAINAGMKHWRDYGKDQVVGSKLEFMTSARLMNSMKEAFNHWKREKLNGRIKVIAVEQAFNVHVGDKYFTAGILDQVVVWNGQLWGRDFKTSTKDEAFFTRTTNPNDQFARYTFAEGILTGSHVAGQLIEVLYNDKPTKTSQKGPKIYTVPVTYTPDQVERWRQEEIHWRKLMDLARENDMYPMNENQCTYCPYHTVCKMPTEAAKMAQLDNFFTVSLPEDR